MLGRQGAGVRSGVLKVGLMSVELSLVGRSITRSQVGGCAPHRPVQAILRVGRLGVRAVPGWVDGLTCMVVENCPDRAPRVAAGGAGAGAGADADAGACVARCGCGCGCRCG